MGSDRVTNDELTYLLKEATKKAPFKLIVDSYSGAFALEVNKYLQKGYTFMATPTYDTDKCYRAFLILKENVHAA